MKSIGLLKTRLYETALNNATVNCDASQLYTECADNRIETWVDEMPTVDPMKHGEWRYDEALELEWCSECGFGKRKGDKRRYSYCPNCGAYMGGVVKHETC